MYFFFFLHITGLCSSVPILRKWHHHSSCSSNNKLRNHPQLVSKTSSNSDNFTSYISLESISLNLYLCLPSPKYHNLLCRLKSPLISCQYSLFSKQLDLDIIHVPYNFPILSIQLMVLVYSQLVQPSPQSSLKFHYQHLSRFNSFTTPK